MTSCKVGDTVKIGDSMVLVEATDQHFVQFRVGLDEVKAFAKRETLVAGRFITVTMIGHPKHGSGYVEFVERAV